MEKFNLFAIFVLIVGIFYLYRIIRSYKNPDFLKKYIETSPKALIWRKKFGVEKAIEITRKYFLPLGLIVSIGLIAYGGYLTAISLNIL